VNSPDDIDCDGTDCVVCPWCGHEEKSPDIDIEHIEDMDCEKCGKHFKIEFDYTVSYSTTRDVIYEKDRREAQAEDAYDARRENESGPLAPPSVPS
jgi:transcription elongation factor Elf1